MNEPTAQQHQQPWHDDPRKLAAALVVLTALAAVPLAAIAAPAACVLIFLLPGWMLVRLWRPMWWAAGRLWLAVALSVVVMSVALHWLWRVTNDPIAILATIGGVNLVLLLAGWGVRREVHARPPALCTDRRGRIALWILLLGVGCCVLATFWVPVAGGRTAPVAAHDYVKHYAMLWSLDRAPLPLQNPFYAGEPDTPYYYYQYLYHLPAALMKLGGGQLPAAVAFGIVAAIVAMACIALVYIIARPYTNDWGALLAALCVSIVGGWDAVPVLMQMAGGEPLRIVLDSWCPVPWRLHNLMTQYVWCPQHVAALVALLLIGVLLRHDRRGALWLVAGPLLIAFIFGTSVYLAIAFFPPLLLYGLGMLRRHRREARRLLLGGGAIALLALLLMLVQLNEYRLIAGRMPGGLTPEWDRFPLALLGRIAPPGPLANLLDLPWLLLIDLGVGAVALLLVRDEFWRRLRNDAAGGLLLLAAVIGTVLFITLRSSTNPFDYSFRLAVMPLQVLGAIAAGALVTQRLRGWRLGAVSGALLLGLPVGAFEAPLMASRTLLLTTPEQREQAAIHYVRQELPPDAVLQCAPRDRLGLPQLIERQIGVLDPDSSHVRVFYPQDMSKMEATAVIADRALRIASASEAYALLRAANVTHVYVGIREREQYEVLAPFNDEMLFEEVYAGEQASIYRLRPAAVRDTSTQPSDEQ